MPKPPFITVLFATMNRMDAAKACVLALAGQTRPPDVVMIADNCSSDETVRVLESLENLPFKLIVHRMPENRGNAGGVETVMDRAFAEGADAVWILDDDSWPRAVALEALIEEPWERDVCRHALQIDPKTGRFTWPLQVDDGAGGWRLVGAIEDMPLGNFVRSRITWTGALVTREIREAIGPVNGALFIRGEDEDYPWRMEQAGFGQEAVRHAILDHPGPEHIVHLKLLGKNFFFEPGLADWKLYYKIRNMIWLSRKKSGGFKTAALALAYAAVTAFIDGIHRLPLVWEATLDGWRGRLGKWD
ncbi:MAG: glycosyltransferase [Gloeobacteraceae cyanobacterium ES-bin-144]|nr:glycosyltransferase [Verrucomicrobiales bacterium]